MTIRPSGARTQATRPPAGPRRAHLRSERSLVFLLFAVAAAAAIADATNPDLFWHLRTGRLIVEDGIPRVDPFSFTVAGRDWITHEWGTQVAVWGLWRLGGAPALIVTFAAVVVCAYGVAARASSARAVPTAVVVVLAAFSSRIATAARPQMVNLVGLALVLFLLERVRQGRLDPRWVWALPAATAVWSNLHSGYLLAVVTIGVYAVGEALELRRGGVALPRPVVHQLPFVAATAFVAAAVNPNGIDMWRYPLDTLVSPAMRTYIREWHRPDLLAPAFWPFVALLAVAAAAMFATRSHLRWTQSLMVLGTAVASLQSMRHIPLFAIVAIAFVSPALQDVWDARPGRRTDRPDRSPILPPLVVALGVLVVAMLASAAIRTNDETVTNTYPEAAVDAISTGPLAEARGYNAYGWGGYLIWRGVPVFIDGRADVYGDEFMTTYFDAWNLQPGWERTLDRYHVDYLLVPPGTAIASAVLATGAWVEHYRDDVAVVVVRCEVIDADGCRAPAG